jgi:rhodanese-related sulfurtransferase
VNSRALPVLLLSGVTWLASCQDPAAVPPVAAPSPPAAPPPPPPDPAPPKSGKVTAIDVTALFSRHQDGTVLLYDARPAFVAAFGKIPGAISWPRANFDQRLALHEPEIRAAAAAGKPVVFYCTDAACPDAGAMARQLAKHGHDVSILEGGYAIWKEAGLPTE